MAIEHQPKVIIAGWSAYPRQLDFAALPCDRRRGRRAALGRHGALRRARRRGPAPEPGAARARRLLDRAQDDRRPALGLHPHQRRRDREEDQLRRVPRPAGRPAHARDRGQGDRVQARGDARVQGPPGAHPQRRAHPRRAAHRSRTSRMPASTCSPAAPTCTSCSSTCATPTIDGKQAEDLLHEIGITVNRNAVPNDPRPPMVTSGLRIGTPALATRGFGDEEFTEVADIIALALHAGRRRRGSARPRRGADRRRSRCTRASPVARYDGRAAHRRNRPSDGSSRDAHPPVKGELRHPIAALPRAASRRPRHAARRRRPRLALLRRGQAPRLRRGRHRVDPRRPAGRRRRRRTSGGDRTSSTRTRRAPATSCSCRCPTGIDEQRDAGADRPREGCRRPAPDQPRAAGARRRAARITRRCRARRPASSSCCAATTCRSPASTSTVIGRGVTVGRPLGLLLTRKGIDATVTLTHSAHGRPGGRGAPGRHRGGRRRRSAPRQAGLVKPGAAVLDVGVTRVSDAETGKAQLTGDVDPAVAEVAGWLSPNPGGVGPDDPRHAAAQRGARPPSGFCASRCIANRCICFMHDGSAGCCPRHPSLRSVYKPPARPWSTCRWISDWARAASASSPALSSIPASLAAASSIMEA